MSSTPSAYALANMADCASPDAPDSPGAEWLQSVYSMATDEDPNEDYLGEYADGLVPIYTHHRWQVFVDLCAYNEDPTDLGADGSDMTQAAGICLYMIAERLIAAVWAERAEDEDDEDDDQ